ncbi:hypothetical protein CCHR01_18123 [Colletotrichum chrysophilum]|uniref:Uncharacterized protein n=1 Tax=Colletotrichum chrysophilum TaxID=1836956 RepID=A0AAD9A0N1_9PEZI|nr:hypothetical protein CCHR01_18123 [Colletotrichum chrysophilum]
MDPAGPARNTSKQQPLIEGDKMPPPKASLDSLATEELLTICEFIYESGFVKSLAKFSLTNKKYRSVASAILARTVKFAVTGLDQYPGYLEQDVTQCYRSLDRDNNFAHGDGWKPRISPAERVDDETRIDGWLQESYDPGHNGVDYGWDEYTMAKVPNEFWKPLAKLIERLPRLKELLYACPNQFPPCLLAALHEHHPSCRLHLRNFHLHSIKDRHGLAAVLDAEETDHELRLASSPCLHSIRYSYANSHGDYGRFNNNEEPNPNNIHNSAVMRYVTRMAPNLKRVHLRPVPDVPDESTQSFPPEPWEAVSHLDLPQSLASLTSIEMDQGFYVSDEVIKVWRESTDMSVLRVLKLKMLEVPALQELAKCNLTSLVHLNIALPYVDRRSYWNVVADALRRVSSHLVTLKIGGFSSEIALDSVLGPCLRTLDLATYNSRVFQEKDILEITARSPLVECLTLRIPRRKGNASEVASYRALGKLKRLRDLSVTLVARPPPISRATLESMGVEDYAYGVFEREIWRVTANKDPGFSTGALKTAVINSAVDARLVRSIVEVITAAKQRNGALSLELLQVDVTGYDQIKLSNKDDTGTAFGEYCSLLGLLWIAWRFVNSDNRAEYFVIPGQDDKYIYRRDKDPIEEVGGIFLWIVEMVWPRAGPTKDLVGRAWHSFPLETDDAIDSPQSL